MLEGLKDSGLCGDGESLEVGILKMPHHGSIRNLDDEGDFLRRVTSRNYVFSGNGEHGNPDRETFELLLETRPGAEMTFFLTYGLDETDAGRKHEYDKARTKALRKGKQVPEWSDEDHSLAAILSEPPAGVEVVAGRDPMIVLP